MNALLQLAAAGTVVALTTLHPGEKVCDDAQNHWQLRSAAGASVGMYRNDDGTYCWLNNGIRGDVTLVRKEGLRP